MSLIVTFDSPSANGVATGFTCERQSNHPQEGEARRIAELVQTDGHLFVTLHWLGPVCSKQAIPPWEIKPKVAIGFRRKDRVVDPVLIRHDHQ